jgi:hypothetical protein
VFESGAPTRPFERIARLDAHFEKTHFIHTTHEAGIAELKKQARLRRQTIPRRLAPVQGFTCMTN